jgi:hypothetical protein
MKTKVCSKCGIEKTVEEFGNRSKSKDGKSGQCKVCHNLRSAEYQKKNYKECLERQKKWRNKNPDWGNSRTKKWISENPEKRKESVKKWREKNPEKRKKYRDSYKTRKHQQRKERREKDPVFNLINRVRCRLWKYINILKIRKNNTTFDIVGCSPEFLKEHLEKQFKVGMTWENKNKWHIDHIVPLSSANNEEELYKLCHYTNLQPLWAEENLKKSNKIV